MTNSEALSNKIKDFFKKNGFHKAVIGLSGGVDSALAVKLAVMALGKENVIGLLMPNEGLSSKESVIDAREWADTLGILYHIIPIQNFIEGYNKLLWERSEEAKMNAQARIRGGILYDYANSHHALVIGTGNKTELTLGYFTKYGDGAADLLPLGNLYKTEVWEMAKELDLPEKIIHKTPSAELRPNHTDEAEIGMKYLEIDEILKKLEAGNEPETLNEKKLATRIQQNQHKMQMPPLL